MQSPRWNSVVLGHMCGTRSAQRRCETQEGHAPIAENVAHTIRLQKEGCLILACQRTRTTPKVHREEP